MPIESNLTSKSVPNENGVLGHNSAFVRRLYWDGDNRGKWDEFCYESCPWSRINLLTCWAAVQRATTVPGCPLKLKNVSEIRKVNTTQHCVVCAAPPPKAVSLMSEVMSSNLTCHFPQPLSRCEVLVQVPVDTFSFFSPVFLFLEAEICNCLYSMFTIRISFTVCFLLQCLLQCMNSVTDFLCHVFYQCVRYDHVVCIFINTILSDFHLLLYQ